MAVFLDITAAFDTVWHHGLLLKLHHLDLEGLLPEYIRSFLHLSRIRLKVFGELTSSTSLASVVRRPSGISFESNIVHNSHQRHLAMLQPNVSTSLYANDEALWVTATDLHSALADLQRAQDAIGVWSQTWGLSLSPQKISAIIFTRCCLVSPPPL